MTDQQDSLTDLRRAIDGIDDEIVARLAVRQGLVERAGRLKRDATAVRAPDRVAAVIRRVRATAERAGADPALVERVYRTMITAFIGLELTATGLRDRPVLAPARPENAGELLTLQRAAYATEARIYGDPGLPAMVQTLDQLAAELATGPGFTATVGTRIVGAVRGRIEGDVLHVGRLTVAPDRQGQGIGTALLAEVEAAAPPGTTKATLFTGHLSVANLRLYERQGYREERRARLTPQVELVHLTKSLPPG
ncbi:GNAT family N-acetyltransferase [Blastococcus goldschmidtiae]|uniref:GNAT family N-acetyltransferase n=1 Tax=Blastococcus goldschmidtiae TaxID=3075546 RepID=A0ABU2K984_9ACTN|nr:GNAT family N-acetyltransferase [Blastococcus sp. DSM 46792]MDT0276743.1 GNAT family N-acetyltransferase [Blastococcus sp. DSM 46792]